MGLRAFCNEYSAVVEVKLTKVQGSSPRDAGVCMFVSAHGLHGTIGGGQLEYMAIDEARAMLHKGDHVRVMDVPLGPEIGQCCGGRVEISLCEMSDAEKSEAVRGDALRQSDQPHVYIFGAGHVGRALVQALALLPVRPVLIDSRAEELDLAKADVEKRLTALPEHEVRSASPGSSFVVLTHDHSLDFLITSEALQRGDARYVGMIGSKTKRALFEKWCRAENTGAVDTNSLICPIGAQGSADKRPEIIATYVAAEIIASLTAKVEEPVSVFSDAMDGEKINEF